jgi:ribonuclease D
MNISLAPPVWVDTLNAMQAMLSDLGEQPAIAVDTESNSLHAYREQVCLIQFSTNSIDYLVDPLAIQDLSVLHALFADPDIEKVFHAAEYDLICLKRDFGFAVSNMFDTRWAVRILGYAGDGLDRVLKDKFNVQSDKKFQKANWASRPLGEEQINYARLDTHYLIPLKDMLEAELSQHGFLDLAREDFKRACRVHIPESRPALWERLGNGYRLGGRERTILKALYECREQIAERLDRPTFKVLSDKQLLDIADKPARHLDDLLGVGLSQKQVGNWGKELLGAVVQGQEAPLVTVGPIKRPDEAFLYRLEALKQWRKMAAREMRVESDVVLPRSLMEKLAEAAPQNMNQLSELMVESPWRLGSFGPQILQALKG